VLTEPTKLAVIGDWHANTRWACNALKYAKDNGADAVLQVGDFGFWRPDDPDTQPHLDEISETAKALGIEVLWLPGNHEYWPGLPHDPGMLPGRGKKPSLINGNLLYLPPGYRWSWWGKNFMAVGGAFSIDRFMRTEGKGYWLEETLTDEDVEYASREPHGLDVIFSHDCPKGVDIPGIGPDSKPRGGASLWPPLMLLQAEEHRQRMKDIWDVHKPQRWIHGHYHVYHETWYGPTIFTGLDMDGTTPETNIMFLGPGDLK